MRKLITMLVLLLLSISIQRQLLYAPERGFEREPGTPPPTKSKTPSTTPSTTPSGATSGIEHVTDFISGKTLTIDLKWDNKTPSDSSYGPHYTHYYINKKTTDIKNSKDENTFLANACALWRILQIKGISDYGTYKTINDTYNAVRQTALNARPYGENGRTAVKKILEVINTDRQNNKALGTGKTLQLALDDDDAFVLRNMYITWGVAQSESNVSTNYSFGNLGSQEIITSYKNKEIKSNPRQIAKILTDKLWPECFITFCATIHYLMVNSGFSTSITTGTADRYFNFISASDAIFNKEDLKNYAPSNGQNALKEVLLKLNSALLDYGTSKAYSSSQQQKLNNWRTTYGATGIAEATK